MAVAFRMMAAVLFQLMALWRHRCRCIRVVHLSKLFWAFWTFWAANSVKTLHFVPSVASGNQLIWSEFNSLLRRTCFLRITLLLTVTAGNSSVSVCVRANTMLYILLLCIATTLARVDIFVFKEYEESGKQGDPTEDTFGGSLPPDLSPTSSFSSSSSSCSCSKLILSSLGPAATFQPHVMGVYTKVDIVKF